MADIFISYASEDRDRVRSLVQALESEGWSVFWDREIPPGRSWDDVIQEALGDARCVVVVWTRHSVESRWVRIEAMEGLEGDILVPVVLDDAEIPIAFRRAQAADLRDPSRANPEFDRFLGAVHRMMGSTHTPTRSKRRCVSFAPSRSLIGVGMLAVALLIVGLTWVFRATQAPSTTLKVTRFTLQFAPTEVLWLGDRLQRASIALSPDGARLVYVASRGREPRQLYLRRMDQFESVALRGTEGAHSPFFSPDGEWVAFFTNVNLKKVSLSSGATVTLAEVVPVSSGGNWGTDDNIVYTEIPPGGLVSVPARGGVPKPLTAPDRSRGDYGHHFPSVLPGGKALLFTILHSPSWGDTGVAVLSLETGEWRILLEQGTNAQYLSTGHLVYALGGTLLAAPFDLERLALSGSPVRLVDDVVTRVGAEFSLSDDGTLAYLPGAWGWQERWLSWVDRKGQELAESCPPRAYSSPRISPDGQRVATTIRDRETGNADIWVCELANDTLTRLTSGTNYDGEPIWTPNGQWMTYTTAGRLHTPDLSWTPADGTGTADALLSMDNAQFPTSWSPDGSTLLFTDEHPDTNYDIWLLPVAADGKTQPWLNTPSVETAAMFSPDGRWIAFQSDESGRFEVYVQRFPVAGRKHQISTQGGTEPVWAPDGRTLFYREADRLMAANVTLSDELSAARPTLLFERRYSAVDPAITANYDITADGERFLMVKDAEQDLTHINVVLNWTEAVTRLVPTDQ